MAVFEQHPFALVLVQFIVILVLSRLIAAAAKRAGQPQVVAEILAGILLGPSLLGWVAPDVMHGLFPAGSLGMLKALSEIGLVLFMFLIGLELDPKLLQGRVRASVVISHTSIAVPFVLGGAAAWWLYPRYSSGEVPFVAFALFMGVSMSITAFPVLARILAERHLMSSRVGTVAIACAAIDDVTAWCLLAFVVAVASASGVAQAFVTTGLAVGYIALMLFVVRPFLRRLAARVAGPEALTPAMTATALVFLLLSSVATELIGVHALFGAFLFGAILPKEGGLAQALADKIETVAVVLLLPLFFAYSGLRTEIGLLSSPADLLATGAIIALATLGKFGASALAARWTGSRWREAGAVGVLMNTRGLMELIALNIGLDLGVISPSIFTMMVIMALVTTIATTPLLQLIYPDRELARDRIAAVVPPPGLQPEPYSVLMCVSDPNSGRGMAELTRALAGEEPGSIRASALYLAPVSERPSVDRRESERPPQQSPMAPLVERASELHLDVKPLSFVSAAPAEDICRTAEAKKAALIVLGWHKPLWWQDRLGGVVQEVIEGAEPPVAVLVDRGLRHVEKVLVPLSGSAEDRGALRLARRLAAREGTSLTLLHVVRPGAGVDEAATWALLDEHLPSHRTLPSLMVKTIEDESPQEAALREASGGYDLVVFGMARRRALDGLQLPWRRQLLLSQAPVSVLVVHDSAGNAEATVPAVDFNTLATHHG